MLQFQQPFTPQALSGEQRELTAVLQPPQYGHTLRCGTESTAGAPHGKQNPSGSQRAGKVLREALEIKEGFVSPDCRHCGAQQWGCGARSDAQPDPLCSVAVGLCDTVLSSSGAV